MKRALFAATALAVAALALPGAQAADKAAATDGAAKSRTGFFERIDADKDGAVTRQEMAAAHADRLAKIDADGDGSISRDEFMASAKSKSSDKASARKARYFDRLDADKSGTITVQEWNAVAEKYFAALDADRDGRVTKDELAAAREKFRKTRGADAPAKGGETKSN